ncbi:MAG TPA: formylglycine-generating enzyme family protein [Burkholderiaceae bacterium]|nr:formylglycine-generating enzyme family protein [Burkholderiaceae bacterium]
MRPARRPTAFAVSPVVQPGRRRLLGALAGLGLGSSLPGCGGGSGSSSGTTASTAVSGTSSDASSAAATAATAITATATAVDPWFWATAGTSTAAVVPSLSDFVQVLGSGTLTYAFHASITSATTDPVTGVTADTSTSATLVPYLIGRYLVTNANWKAFCNAMGSGYHPSTSTAAGQYWYGGAYPAGKENHPVFFVSYADALAYCAWLETQISGYIFYVPTEGEWEYAALGSHSGYSYPWGTSADIGYNASTGAFSAPFNCNAACTEYLLTSSGLTTLSYYDDTTVTTLADGTTALTSDTAPLSSVLAMSSSGAVTGWQYDSDTNSTWADFANSDQFHSLVFLYGGYSTAVGAYESGKSWCGCYDMAGNAYEWTSTLNVASNGAESGSEVHCVKGGSWYATAASGKSSGRGEGRAPGGAYHSVGLRVAARAK